MANDLSERLRRSRRISHSTVDGQTIIMLPHEEEVMVLNETGGVVWSLTDGKRTVDEVADLVAAEFGVDSAQVRTDVETLYRELQAAGAVEPAE